MSKTTPILLTTHTLSKAVDEIVAQQQALLASPQPRAISKPRVLSILAGLIAGPKHDWGYLTGAKDRIVARDAQRFAQEAAPTSTHALYFYQMDERDDWARGLAGPFSSRAACLAAIAADKSWHAEEYPVHEVIHALATQDEFVFFSTDENEAYEDASPYSLTIHRIMPPKGDSPEAEMPIVGYQITHPDAIPYDHDGPEWYPASFEMFPTQEAALALIPTLNVPHLHLIATPIRAGAIENPAWV